MTENIEDSTLIELLVELHSRKSSVLQDTLERILVNPELAQRKLQDLISPRRLREDCTYLRNIIERIYEEHIEEEPLLQPEVEKYQELTTALGREINEIEFTSSPRQLISLSKAIDNFCSELMPYAKLMSDVDGLTKLKRSSYFNSTLDLYLNEWLHDPKEIFSIVHIDVNNLSLINNECGHKYGNEVLKQLASILLETCRGVIARVGGDEIGMLMLGIDGDSACEVMEGKAERLTERLKREVRWSYEREGRAYPAKAEKRSLTVSIGISCPERSGDNCLIERALSKVPECAPPHIKELKFTAFTRRIAGHSLHTLALVPEINRHLLLGLLHETVYVEADKACYLSKEKGKEKSNVSLFDPALPDESYSGYSRNT